MTSSYSNQLPSKKEECHQTRLVYAHYLAAQATADWLCGKSPTAICSHPLTDELGAGEVDKNKGLACVKLGTEMVPFEVDGFPGYYDLSLCALAMNEALVVLAGSAAIFAHPFDRRYFPGCRKHLTSDMWLAKNHLMPVCASDREALSVAYLVWDVALTLARHPRIWACIEDLARKVVERHRIGNEAYELEEHFERHLSGLQIPPFEDGENGDDVSVISWPEKGIAEFSNPNWGTLMIASSAKGRAHYARQR